MDQSTESPFPRQSPHSWSGHWHWKREGGDSGCLRTPQAGAGAAGAADAPPECNTGAQNTQALIDGFRVTFPEARLTPEEICSLFSPSGGWISLPHGFRGYRKAVQRPGLTVQFDGRPGMGVHVEVSGSGCRQLEAEGVVYDWPLFFRGLIACGGSFVRLDCAIDERSGLLDLEEVSNTAWVGRAEKRQVVRSTDKEGGVDGHTVYFGSRESETFVRVYDKAKEQKVEGHWVRAEVELKRERAHAMAEAISGGEVASAVAGVLRSHLNFVERSEDSNRSRWPVCGWWLTFLDHAEKVRLVVGKAVRTIEKSKAWVDRQVAPVLAMLWVHQGCEWEWLQQTVRLAVDRMRPHHKALALSGGREFAVRPPDHGTLLGAV